MQIMQGDAYEVAITLKDDNDTTITSADVADVEITLGNLSKTYTDGAISYDDGEWLFPLSQDESFALNAISRLQVRVKNNSGEVIGANVGIVFVKPSQSAKVL